MRAPLLLILSFGFACSTEANKQFVPLAESVAIPAGVSFELLASEPLRTPAYHHQVCFLPVAPVRLADDPMGIVDSEGRPIAVQVAASGPGGKVQLPLSAYQDQRICYGISDTDLEQQFSSIHLEVSAPIQIERVEWQSTDK
jgi:hypothetical protein